MSFEDSNIILNAIVRLRQSYSELFVTFTVSRNITISQLIEHIDQQLKTRHNYQSTSIYYMFNEFQTTMNEEARLGGVLLPHDCMLEFSMIESGSTLFVEAEPYVRQAGEELDEKEELEERQEQEPAQAAVSDQHSNQLNNDLYRFNNNIDRYVNSLNNAFNQPVVDIDDQARVMDMYSVIDLFSTVAGFSRRVQLPINQVHRPINNRLLDLLQMMQVPILNNSLLNNNLNNLQDIPVGLHPDDLDRLKNGLYKDLKDTNKHKLDTCSICFDQFNEEDKCRELKCSHMFHQKCIDHWLNDHITCPVCREETGKSLPRM